MKCYRQGDVMIVEASIPAGVTELPRDNGRVVLAYGEVTGHAHAIHTPNAVRFRDAEGGTYLSVKDAPAPLTHEEHTRVDIAVGNYLVVIQSEYTPAAMRNVAD